MRRWMISAVVALGLGSVACGGRDPVDRAITQGQITQDVLCECPASVGVATEAECRERVEMSSITEAEEACVRRVYQAHRAELDPVLDCQYDASVELTDCMRAALETCPPELGASSACSTAFTATTEDCPTASTQTEAELQACFASRT